MCDSTQLWEIVPLLTILGLDIHVGLYHNVRAFMTSVVFIHSLIWKLLLVVFFLCYFLLNIFKTLILSKLQAYCFVFVIIQLWICKSVNWSQNVPGLFKWHCYWPVIWVEMVVLMFSIIHVLHLLCVYTCTSKVSLLVTLVWEIARGVYFINSSRMDLFVVNISNLLSLPSVLTQSELIVVSQISSTDWLTGHPKGFSLWHWADHR